MAGDPGTRQYFIGLTITSTTYNSKITRNKVNNIIIYI